MGDADIVDGIDLKGDAGGDDVERPSEDKIALQTMKRLLRRFKHLVVGVSEP